MITPIKLFLFSYLIIFFMSVFVLRIFFTYKKTGINVHKLLNQNGPDGKLGFYYKLITYLNVVAVLLYVYTPQGYQWLSPISWLVKDKIQYIGIGLLMITLPLICLAQAQMGNSWRINIDNKNKTGLITHGLFAKSRNPIFLFMKINLVATFLVIPNGVSLSVLLTGIALIDVQVAMEEVHLINAHPQAYKSYCQKVNRWF